MDFKPISVKENSKASQTSQTDCYKTGVGSPKPSCSSMPDEEIEIEENTSTELGFLMSGSDGDEAAGGSVDKVTETDNEMSVNTDWAKVLPIMLQTLKNEAHTSTDDCLPGPSNIKKFKYVEDDDVNLPACCSMEVSEGDKNSQELTNTEHTHEFYKVNLGSSSNYKINRQGWRGPVFKKRCLASAGVKMKSPGQGDQKLKFLSRMLEDRHNIEMEMEALRQSVTLQKQQEEELRLKIELLKKHL